MGDLLELSYMLPPTTVMNDEGGSSGFLRLADLLFCLEMICCPRTREPLLEELLVLCMEKLAARFFLTRSLSI